MHNLIFYNKNLFVLNTASLQDLDVRSSTLRTGGKEKEEEKQMISDFGLLESLVFLALTNPGLTCLLSIGITAAGVTVFSAQRTTICMKLQWEVDLSYYSLQCVCLQIFKVRGGRIRQN